MYKKFASITAFLLSCQGGIPSQTFSTDPVGDVSGRVLDIGTGQPLPGAEIKLTDRFAVTDSSGTYQIFDLPVGQHAITAEQDGYTAYYSTITISQSATVFDVFLVPFIGENCTDLDGDGHGIGPDCLGPDCNDQDRGRQNNCQMSSPCDNVVCGPGEQCTSSSQGANCDCINNYTRCGGLCQPMTTECMPGCQDSDMDGYGVGAACSGWDCDDNDPSIQASCPTGGTGTVVGRVELDPMGDVENVIIRVGNLTASPGPDATFRIDGVPAGFATIEVELAPYFPVQVPNVPVLADSAYDAGTISLSLDIYLCDQQIESGSGGFGGFSMSPQGSRLMLSCADGNQRAYTLSPQGATELALPSDGNRMDGFLSEELMLSWDFAGSFPALTIDTRYYDVASAQRVGELNLDTPMILPRHRVSPDNQKLTFTLGGSIHLFRIATGALDTVVSTAETELPLQVGWQGDELLYGVIGSTDYPFSDANTSWTVNGADLRALSDSQGTRFIFQSDPSSVLIEAQTGSVGNHDGVMVVREISQGVHTGDALFGYNLSTSTVDRLHSGSSGVYRRLIHIDAMRSLIVFAETDTADNRATPFSPNGINGFTQVRWYNLSNNQSGNLITGRGSNIDTGVGFGADAISCVDAKAGQELLCKQEETPFPLGESTLYRVNLNTLAADSLGTLWLLSLGSQFYLGNQDRTYYQLSANSNNPVLWAFREVGGMLQDMEVLRADAIEMFPGKNMLLYRRGDGVYIRKLESGLNVP